LPQRRSRGTAAGDRRRWRARAACDADESRARLGTWVLCVVDASAETGEDEKSELWKERGEGE
jgi:hypothetical protein